MKQEEALKWIAELFEEPENNVKPETLRDDIESWDSLGVLTLMAALDEEFEILLSEDEIINLSKVDDILEILKQNNLLE